MSVQKSSDVRAGKGDRTKTAILDAAEREFARGGFDGVSMRAVAEASGQLLGVLTYHFSTKEQLFEAVVKRRVEEVTDVRAQMVSGLVNPTLEDLLEASFGTFLEKIASGEEGWQYYFQILAMVAQQSRWAYLVDQLYGETSWTFIELMRKAEPRLSVEAATRGLVYFITVMLGFFVSTGLLDRLSNGKLSGSDLCSNYRSTVCFIVSGWRGLAQLDANAEDGAALLAGR